MLSQAARVVETAKGDGNCAFNAFVLGFCEPGVLDHVQLPDNHFFVVEASRLLALNPPATWAILKKHLLTADRMALQTTLAPLMRKIAIQSLLDYPEQKAVHLEGTTAAIQAELQKYFEERRTKEAEAVDKKVVGDIFIRHPFIQNKFEALYQSGQCIDEAQILLSKWWKQEKGHDTFLQHMSVPAKSAVETDLYAGDLELAPLGAYFGLNVRVKSDKRDPRLIYSANGKMDLDELFVPALTNRGLIDTGNSKWEALSRAQVEARLNAIPQLDAVTQYIQLCVKETDAAPKQGDVVPDTWSPECREQLLARNIINPRGLFVGVREPDLTTRIQEFPLKAAVLASYDRSYVQRPTVAFQNENATHWNNLKLAPGPSPVSGQQRGVDNTKPAQKTPKPPMAATLTSGQVSKRSAAKTIKKSTPHAAPLTTATQTKTGKKRPSQSTATMTSTLSSTNTAKTQATQSIAAATVKAKPYQPNPGVQEVNDAMNMVFDLLEKNRKAPPPLTDDEVKHIFENTFEQFSTVLDEFRHNKISPTLFQQKKQKILDDAQQIVATVKSAKKP